MRVLWKHRLRTDGTVTILARRFAVGSDGLLNPQPADLSDEERDAVVSVLEAVPGNYAKVLPPKDAASDPTPPPAVPTATSETDASTSARPVVRPAPRGRPGASPRP